MTDFNVDNVAEKAIEAICQVYAIANTSKIYHWQSFGRCFESDHLLFDRIHDDLFDLGWIDTVAEAVAMPKETRNLDCLNDVTHWVAERQGRKFYEEDFNSETLNEMFSTLQEMLHHYFSEYADYKEIKQVSPVFDEINQRVSILQGLVDARCMGLDSNEEGQRVLSRLIINKK